MGWITRTLGTVLRGSLAAGTLALLVACTREIDVGVSLTLSGTQAVLGQDVRDGIFQGVDDLKANYPFITLKLHIVDDQSDPALALANDTFLIKSGVDAVLGHATSGLTSHVLPEFDRAGTVLLSPTASSRSLAIRDDHLFRLVGTNAQESRGLAAWVQGEGLADVAIVVDVANQSFGNDWFNEFTAGVEASGGQHPQAVWYDGSSPASREGLLGQFFSANPGVQAIGFVGSPLDVAKFCQELSRLGWSGKMFSSGWAKNQELIQAGGRTVEGMVFAEQFNPWSTDPAWLAFRLRFIERFGREPSGAAVQAWESVLYLLEALTKKRAHEPLRDAMARVPFIEGLQGQVSFDAAGDAQRPISLTVVKDGTFVPLN